MNKRLNPRNVNRKGVVKVRVRTIEGWSSHIEWLDAKGNILLTTSADSRRIWGTHNGGLSSRPSFPGIPNDIDISLWELSENKRTLCARGEGRELIRSFPVEVIGE